MTVYDTSLRVIDYGGLTNTVIMADLRSKCRHYISAPWFLVLLYGRPME